VCVDHNGRLERTRPEYRGMIRLQCPDRVHHIEDRGDCESDEKHQNSDRSFEVVEGVVKDDLVGGKGGGRSEEGHGAPNSNMSYLIESRNRTYHARAMLGIEKRIEHAKMWDFSSLISCGM
jgi:hypothetical protein